MSYSIPKVPYYCQWLGFINDDRTVSFDQEPAMSLEISGSGSGTVANSGCGPSCVAMALSFIKNQVISLATLINNPGTAKFMVGADSSLAGSWNLGANIAAAYGVSAKRTHDTTEALTALKNGNLVMAIMGNADVGALPSGESTRWTSGGHYILLIGVTDAGRIAVADPGNPKNSYWFKGVKRPQLSEDWTWPVGGTVTWNQITKAARIPGNSNTGGSVASGGAFTIFTVPEERKSGSYTPATPPTVSKSVVKEEKGIKGLVIDFEKWKAGTHLMRIGDYVILKATVLDGTRTVQWQDITDKLNPITYTPTQLSRHFGISYTKVNNGYTGKFYVCQSPLSPALGGTGVSTIDELLQAINGINSAPGGYDYDTLETYSVSSDKISLPTLPIGHIMTAEARSAERGGLGSESIGDQAQPSDNTKLDTVGEVSFIYDRNVKDFTNVYRLISSDPSKAAEYKVMALCTANHACFMAQNSHLGYNYYTSGQAGLWNYVKESRSSKSTRFGNIDTKYDTNCINFCKIAYASVFPDYTVKGSLFNNFWTTAGILSSTTLESLGFTKLGASYAQNPANLEIGDILIKNGHAALVVDVGGKSWEFNGVDYNPKNGEVIT